MDLSEAIEPMTDSITLAAFGFHGGWAGTRTIQGASSIGWNYSSNLQFNGLQLFVVGIKLST